jgi:hypothetical protein
MQKFVYTFSDNDPLDAPIAIEHGLATKDLIVGSRLASGFKADNIKRVITQTENLVVVEPTQYFEDGQTLILIG